MNFRCVNTRKLSRGPLKVRIIKVNTLGHAREDLEELSEELTHRMARKGRFLRQNPYRVLPDELVAIREGKTWQRGVVVRLESKNMVTVALRDWGRIIQRPIEDMHVLEDRFRELNWQAIPCGLDHLCPIGARSRWPRRSRELTRLLLERREGWMRIIRSIENEGAVITFEPRRESEDEMSSLKNLLISMGCAQHRRRNIINKLDKIMTWRLEVPTTYADLEALAPLSTGSADFINQKHHWYAYKYLTNLRCINTWENQPMYQHSDNPSKICQNCYKCEPANLRLNYLPVFSHHLIHMDSIFEQAKCINFNKVMTITREAEECSDCLLEFQYIDANVKARLDLTWGLPVGLKH
ncbi:hypothetical protein ALC57_13278 [Trachymyrmex cornetzi]|uniref:Tudor domain-containing protein n=1 Tax=Trachymyrmex cornetzi TaxID=471704 RepID=A0A151IZI5_9HYME|nr:hypothetical protein ALC57_13278 [Trachymyrmex cornetzi]